MTTLIVYYTRSGNTKKAAEELAKELGASLLELREDRPRKGIFGFMRSGFEAALKKTVPIKPFSENLSSFDRVVIATPVWAGHVCSPMRTFLMDNAKQIKDLGVLETHSHEDFVYKAVIAEIAALVGKKPTLERSVLGKLSVK